MKDRGSGLVEVECSLLEWLGQVRLEGLMKWLAQDGMQLIEVVRIGYIRRDEVASSEWNVASVRRG